MKGVMRLGKKAKLSPRYIGPFEILERVGDVAYRRALPPSLSAFHHVFHTLFHDLMSPVGPYRDLGHEQCPESKESKSPVISHLRDQASQLQSLRGSYLRSTHRKCKEKLGQRFSHLRKKFGKGSDCKCDH
uniref:Uncharacterized protein LOC104230756 n=1 Tax=Nicotiana sylvestris TaxID=4096 RepID=A0A1U7WTK6_NICSY|nr:PREDICTED: uncharacterized protein LOC104230756 [Nicotiana sylvestris]